MFAQGFLGQLSAMNFVVPISSAFIWFRSWFKLGPYKFWVKVSTQQLNAI